MAEKWAQPGLPMAERTLIKDRLRYLDGRCEWISNEVQRRYVQGPIDQLWQKILQTA
jgi:MoxR-like ATPase